MALMSSVFNDHGYKHSGTINFNYKVVDIYGEFDKCHLQNKSRKPTEEFFEKPPLIDCPDRFTDDNINVFVIGDSHAAVWQSVIKRTYPQLHKVQHTGANCPMLSGNVPSKSPGCEHILSAVFKELENAPPSIVVWANYWLKYQLFNNKDVQNTLRVTLDNIESMGHKVIIVGQSPLYNPQLPVVVKNYLESNNHQLPEWIDEQSGLIDWFMPREQMFHEFISEVTDAYIRPRDVFCDAQQARCNPIVEVNNKIAITTFDHDHMTPEAVTKVLSEDKFVAFMDTYINELSK